MNFDKHINWKEFEEKIGYTIKNKNLFLKAFTHRSFLNEHQDYKNNSNERLEFLGDAILQFLVTEKLFNKYPQTPEGELTNYRAATVNTKSLAQESLRLNFGKYLLMSVGEEKTGGREKEYILANTFESVLGAIYVDSKNINTCRKYLEINLFYKIDSIVSNNKYKDSKSRLQEITQKNLI